MPYGLDETGFTRPTLQDIKTELEEEFKAAFGQSIDVSPQSVFGQIIGTMADRFADIWEMAEAVYSSQHPDNAEGVALENLCALTGTVPLEPEPSTVTGTCTGTPGTTLPTGRQASVTETGVKFETTAEATIVAVDAWVDSTAYVLDDRVTNNSKVYVCITAGTSAGSGGPSTSSSDITDGTAHWRYLGDGTGAVDVEFESVEDGEQIAQSGTLTVIETPVSGWSSVMNILDAELGQEVETDPELRLRREAELNGPAKSALESIRTNLLAVDDVESVTVFVNNTDATDGDGMPPHSIECLVRGGDDEEVRQAVFENVAAGIQPYGSDSGTVTDSQGVEHTVAFSRPDEIEIYVRVDVTKDPDEFPTDGEDQIKDAIVAWGDEFQGGKDVTASAVSAQVFGIAGVLDVTVCYISTSPTPASAATITIDLRELAVFDTSRITVNLSDGTP